MNNKVSVIIPNYNHAKYLQERIESVLNQTVKPFEIIILDDCSTDNSVEIINKYIDTNPEIVFKKNEQNSGSTFAQWNKGVALAKGDLIWIAESDDSSDSFFLEKMLNCFNSNTSIVLAYCQSNKIDANSNQIGSWKSFTDEFDANLFNSDFEMDGDDFIEKFLIHKNCIPNASAVVFKKENYFACEGATPELKSHGDWLVWLKLLCQGRVSFISQALNNFRNHSESVIAKALAIENKHEFKDWYGLDMRQYFAKYLKSNFHNKFEKIQFGNQYYISIDRGNLGLFLLKNKKYLKAWKLILQASFSPKFKSGYLKKAIF